MRAVAGARWACRGCGFCCRFHQLGPVEPEIVELLRASAPETWWPPAAAGWVASRPGPTGLVHELLKVDGHCVFLAEDQRCAVHAHLGPQAKPGFCRLFPYQFVEDPAGVAVVVRSSCSGLVESRVDGDPVAGAEDALALARAGGVVLSWAPEQVVLLPGWEVDLATWMDWEARLLDWLADADGPPHALVAGLRDRLAAWGGRTLPAPDPARARLATRAVVMALDMTLSRVQATETPPSQAEADYVAELLDRVRRAAASLEAGAPLVGADPAYVRELLASELLGKDLHRLGALFGGLGRLLVGVEVAARSSGEGGPAAFGRAHSRVVRFTLNRSVRHVLLRARPALDDLALHATAG